MERTTDRLAEHAALLANRAAVLAMSDSSDLVAVMMSATDGDVLDFHEQACQVLRLAQAAVIAAAGEVGRRSEVSLPDPLARRHGEKNAAALLAIRCRLPERETAAQVALGIALTPREGLTGETLPPFFAVVAAALASGDISSSAARVVVTALQRVEPHASAADLVELEEILVIGARDQWSARTLSDVCRAIPDRFDPDGVEPREAAIYARRGARRRVLDDGTIQWILSFDPEGAAHFEAALDARTAPRRQPRFVDVEDAQVDSTEASTDSGDRALADDRTLEQKRLDAVVDIARDSLRGDDGEMSGVDTTAVIHLESSVVTTGEGQAWFEGIETPVSPTTARRAAATAGIIPVVLGADGVPIEVGSIRRFFSAAQRRAMAVRDGGCVWPDCNAPPRWCDAAHVTPWAATHNTDITNGVLLCHFHHRRFDTDGWSLRFDSGLPWLIPPPHLDPERRPRAGGNPRGTSNPLSRGVLTVPTKQQTG